MLLFEDKITNQKGFTLVELAIVMIIIGLLIAGVLKGQEMIANAQVSKTIVQFKSIDAATSTFQEIYNAFPGDMINASARLRNCNAGNCNNGNGNGRLDASVFGGAAQDEGVFYFTQMAAADLISGIDGETLTFGSALPAAAVGGGFVAGFFSFSNSFFQIPSGHYLTLTGDPTVSSYEDIGVLTVRQAARIDRKIDDGLPWQGSVFVSFVVCSISFQEYNEVDGDLLCPMSFHIQG